MQTMSRRSAPRGPGVQLALSPELEEELVLKKARELYTRSYFLSGRYASFNKLMADPLMGRCMRLAAQQCLRSASRTRGR